MAAAEAEEEPAQIECHELTPPEVAIWNSAFVPKEYTPSTQLTFTRQKNLKQL